MDGRCDKHSFEPAEKICRTCGGEYCADCLVYSHGHRKPPYCVSCALAAAGVRSSASRPVVRSKRDIRRAIRDERKTAKAQAKAASKGESIGFDDDVVTPVRVVEYEFTIADDGSIERPAESRAS
jgi:hypothetical protein